MTPSMGTADPPGHFFQDRPSPLEVVSYCHKRRQNSRRTIWWVMIASFSYAGRIVAEEKRIFRDGSSNSHFSIQFDRAQGKVTERIADDLGGFEGAIWCQPLDQGGTESIRSEELKSAYRSGEPPIGELHELITVHQQDPLPLPVSQD